MTESKASTIQLAGLVLCGGESRRMGTDKGLILKDGQPWFLQIGNLIASLQLPVYFSIRTDQVDAYSMYVNKQSLVVDDSISEGPLRGVLSAFKEVNTGGLLVIACDMPELEISVIESLLNAYAHNHNDFYAYHDGSFYHPFPAVYLRRGVDALPAAKSLQQLLQNGDTFALSPPDPLLLRDYNQLP